jgi:rhodanese-related sulfurtransferase
MINLIKRLFGIQPPPDFRQLMKDGATIIDVRTKGEYQAGHINGSVNIPLDTIAKNISKINRGKAVITCCASGMRSASAKSILKANGFSEVYNGGGWMSLKNKISHK